MLRRWRPPCQAPLSARREEVRHRDRRGPRPPLLYPPCSSGTRGESRRISVRQFPPRGTTAGGEVVVSISCSVAGKRVAESLARASEVLVNYCIVGQMRVLGIQRFCGVCAEGDTLRHAVRQQGQGHVHPERQNPTTFFRHSFI